MDRLDLAAQIIGHWRAVCLVFFVHIVTKGLTLGIEYDRNIAVIVALYERANHVDNTFHCTRWHAFTVNQRRERMECPKQIRRAVN